VIFKATWRPFNSGGKWLEFDKEREGEDLLEPLKLEDIKPNTLYYMQQVWKPNEFHPTYFDPAVSWDTIQELHKTGRLWRLIPEQKEQDTSWT
jgi:hypothetical protein